MENEFLENVELRPGDASNVLIEEVEVEVEVEAAVDSSKDSVPPSAFVMDE